MSAAMEKIIKAFEPYTKDSTTFDIVRSEKLGYVWLDVEISTKIVLSTTIIDDDDVDLMLEFLTLEVVESRLGRTAYTAVYVKDAEDMAHRLRDVMQKIPEYTHKIMKHIPIQYHQFFAE